MLARVDLDFQPQRDRGRVLRVEPVDEGNAPLGLFPLRLAEPGIENFAQRFHRRTCRLDPCLDKIDVLGITSGGFEVKFVECRAAPERKSIAQQRMRKYLYDRAADYEILLDLEVLDPRNDRPPFADKVTGDHNYASTFALT